MNLFQMLINKIIKNESFRAIHLGTWNHLKNTTFSMAFQIIQICWNFFMTTVFNITTRMSFVTKNNFHKFRLLNESWNFWVVALILAEWTFFFTKEALFGFTAFT